MSNLTKEKLKRYAEGSDITSFVAEDILSKIVDYSGNTKERVSLYMDDLFPGGCASGFVGGLIYYDITHKFFDTYLQIDSGV